MGPRGANKLSANRIAAVDRQADALRLRKAGLTFDAIATELGYSSATGAYKAVSTALRKTLQEPADELRKLECERLDAALAALWPKIEKGDTWAIERMIAIMDRRAKLLGLDAPAKSAVAVDVGTWELLGISTDELRGVIMPAVEG